MNLCTARSPRVGKRMRSIAGNDRTRLAKRDRTMRSYTATRSRSEAGGSCSEVTNPVYLGTPSWHSQPAGAKWTTFGKPRALFL
jgi:hypothetical protein